MRLRIWIAAALCLLVAAACASKGKPKVDRLEGRPRVEGPNCTGPRKRVAILRVGGTGHYGAYEGWDVGDALSAQLGTQLQGTDCFLIVDRAVLSDVLREQELGLAGVSSRETAPRAGLLMGAQIFIKLEVSEFEPGNKGRGLSLGLGLPRTPLGVRLGGNKSTAHLAFDVRLIDASTGQVLQTHRVESKASSRGLVLGLDYKRGSVGTDSFDKTPFGKAARKAMDQAAALIVRSLEEVSWTGHVVQSDGDTIFVNAGEETGIRVGDTFTVSAIARELIDPATGLSLGRLETELGRLRIESVNARYSVARALGAFEVKRGDLIRR
jgi:curli biogenesis system outer membrane secretion channel CsgG